MTSFSFDWLDYDNTVRITAWSRPGGPRLYKDFSRPAYLALGEAECCRLAEEELGRSEAGSRWTRGNGDTIEFDDEVLLVSNIPSGKDRVFWYQEVHDVAKRGHIHLNLTLLPRNSTPMEFNKIPFQGHKASMMVIDEWGDVPKMSHESARKEARELEQKVQNAVLDKMLRNMELTTGATAARKSRVLLLCAV